MIVAVLSPLEIMPSSVSLDSPTSPRALKTCQRSACRTISNPLVVNLSWIRNKIDPLLVLTWSKISPGLDRVEVHQQPHSIATVLPKPRRSVPQVIGCS